MKKKVRVWNDKGQYIGDFEVPEFHPQYVIYLGHLYSYSTVYNVYYKTPSSDVYNVNTLWTTNVKTTQQTSKQ